MRKWLYCHTTHRDFLFDRVPSLSRMDLRKKGEKIFKNGISRIVVLHSRCPTQWPQCFRNPRYSLSFEHGQNLQHHCSFDNLVIFLVDYDITVSFIEGRHSDVDWMATKPFFGKKNRLHVSTHWRSFLLNDTVINVYGFWKCPHKMTLFFPFVNILFNNVKNYVPINPFPSEWVLRALIDFTLSNARRFYSSMGNLLDGKGLTPFRPNECSGHL